MKALFRYTSYKVARLLLLLCWSWFLVLTLACLLLFSSRTSMSSKDINFPTRALANQDRTSLTNQDS